MIVKHAVLSIAAAAGLHSGLYRRLATSRGARMKNYYIGAAALAGTVLLFMGWLADHQRKAAIERLEQWTPPASDRAR